MSGNQTDNLLLLDLTTGLARTPEVGGTPDTIQLSTDVELISGANMLVDGDLTVNGTTTTVHSQQVNIRDNHLYLNADYTTTVAETGGLVINVLPTATADTVAAGGFTAGNGGVSNPTVVTTGSGTFSAGDIIQVAGANDQSNDGIFEVWTHVGNTLTIKGIGITGATVPWVLNDFATDATAGGDIRVVNVNVLEGNSSGDWQTAMVNTTTGIAYSTLTKQGIVDLQEAYEQGNTITTSATYGNVVIAGTQLLQVTATGGIDLNTQFDADVTVFDVQMTGTNGFSIDGTATSNIGVDSGNLDLATTTTGDINISAIQELDLDAGTTLVGNTANDADASGHDITFTAGSSTAGGANGASIILTPGDGNVAGVAGSVDVTGPNDEDEAIFTLETTGTNGDKIEMFVGDSDPSGVITGLAGSLFFRDTGTGAEVYLNTSANSGTAWTALSTAAGATLQSAYEAGNTITTSATEGDITFQGTEDFIVGGGVTVDFDTTDAISFDADVASNFTVDGGNLTLSTTTSGTLALTSADDIQVTFEAGNASAMVFDDGVNNYITLDSTAANQAVELNQFLDLVGKGGGITLTAGESLTAGDVVTIEDTTGDCIKADSNTGVTIDGLCIGIVAIGANDTNPVKVFTVPGSLIPVTFAAAPAANRNGDPVWVSQTPGVATLTPPTASGNVQYVIGILQGADGANTSPLIVFQPQFIAVRP